MSPSDFRWYVQNAIEQCDRFLIAENPNYHSLTNQILKIREIGLEYGNSIIKDSAEKLAVYNSSDYELDIIEQIIAILLNLKSQSPYSNKESSKKKRYLIQVKLLLHGIDEGLRRQGH